MKTKIRLGGLTALIVLSSLSPTALAQGNRGRASQRERENQRQEDKRRQSSKNDWRNLATLAGGLTAFGLIKKDPTLSLVGAAGALYSVDRYEKDRKSQDKGDRARASLFSKPYINRDGERYYRRTMVSKGQKYYQFERHH